MPKPKQGSRWQRQMGRGEWIMLSLATSSQDAGLHIVLVLQYLFWMEAIFLKNVASDFCNIEIKHYFVIDIISAVKYLGHLSQCTDKCQKD